MDLYNDWIPVEDCEREYKLDKKDLETDARCDFFECIKPQ